MAARLQKSLIHWPIGSNPCRAEACRLTNCEALLPKYGAIRAPQLDSPVAIAITADGVAAERAVTGAGIGLDTELHRPMQAIALIPAVLDRGGGCGFELRIEEHRPGRNRAVRSLAPPLLEGGAELRRDHRWYRGRSYRRRRRRVDRVCLASSGWSGLRGRLLPRDWFGRRRRWLRGRSLARWGYLLLGPQRRLLRRTVPGPGH